MIEFLQEYGMLLLKETGVTLYMTFTASFFSYLFGLPMGVLVFTSAPGSLHPNKGINSVLGWFINIGRSIPFIILIVALVPFTRLIVGKAIGPTAAIVPLVIAASPFVARMVETSIQAIDPGVIESSRAMGATNMQIIYKVILPEILPNLILGASITVITVLGYTAMAGAVGGGGLGDVAIRYGYHRYEYNVMLATIVILVLLVQLVQLMFNFISVKINKNK